MPDFKHRSSYSLFAYKPAATTKLLFFIILSVALMTLDHRYNNLEVIRAGLSGAVYPLRVAASFPYKFGHELLEDISARGTLLERNATLESQALKLRGRLQRMATIKHENTRLRALMDATARTQGKMRIAEIMAVDLDPFRQQITLNLGDTNDVYLGQPLLGAKGVMGQVTHLGPFSSTVLLITDPNASIPVEIMRDGLRTIAVGTGDSNQLNLPYLPNNADINVGDQLVTSGLGGRFPRGYPVGIVTAIDKRPGAPFAQIKAEPAAQLGRTHQVLLLWPPSAAAHLQESGHAATADREP